VRVVQRRQPGADIEELADTALPAQMPDDSNQERTFGASTIGDVRDLSQDGIPCRTVGLVVVLATKPVVPQIRADCGAARSGRTPWASPCPWWPTALLYAVRLGPVDDATAVTAEQLRAVINRLITAGQWRRGDPDILIVADTGYDITRLAYVPSSNRAPLGHAPRRDSSPPLTAPRPTGVPGGSRRAACEPAGTMPAPILRRYPSVWLIRRPTVTSQRIGFPGSAQPDA
jgi:hypothetical protein